MKSAPFTKSYNGRCVLSVPELEWNPGTITAVIGANGSGKSTLGKVLSGVARSDEKRPVLTGCEIGYLPQKPYALRMSVEKNILLNGSDHALANQMMDALNLTPIRRNRANRLSGGETAKMALARILMRHYDLLILDEPTAAMDMESTAAAEQLIKTYAKNHNCAVIFITHSLSQAIRMSDCTLYLEAGKRIESGETGTVLKAPKTPELKHFLDFYGM